MSNTTIFQKEKPEISTVEEKILLEKQLPFDPKSKKGPTVDLYFHELAKEKSSSQKILQFFGTAFLSLLFFISFPLIALLIKISSGEDIFNKVEVPGHRGIVFEQYQYPTSSGVGSFLRKSGLYKLPSIINIWKGEMDLVGPSPYPAEWCNYWNKQLSEFYKRFAIKPGYVGLSKPISDPEDLDAAAKSLHKDFKYVANPSLKKDFHHLFGSA